MRTRILAFLMMLMTVPAFAQTPPGVLIERLLARVNGTPITLTDLQAARGLGVVEGATDAEALPRLIDRQLMLAEVARFPPPDPPAAAIDAQVAREREVAGTRLPALMAATGLDDARIRDMARDTLRIRAYIDQRFGTAVQVTDSEAELYYLAHPAEFRRDNVPIPFEEALPTARERANTERRAAQVDRWLGDLRSRADVAITGA